MNAVHPMAPWPHYGEDEVSAVAEVLRSGKVNYWTGEHCKRFEEEYAATTGRKHGIALANGTVALELALFSFGIGAGDEVITSSRTFIASASCAVARGAVPVIADVDPVSQNITVETIARVVTSSTRAIIAVHLAGWPCQMDKIMEFAEQRGIKVIEDCAQSHGATYQGKAVGSFGHAAAFSFCQDKIISTGGEGGMLVLDDDDAWKKAWAYKDHGKSHEAVYHRQHPPGFRWLHESFGTNWRMTEMQAAIGRIQLRKLPGWIERRRSAANKFNHAFAALPGLLVTLPPDEVGHAYYKYYVFVRPERLKPGWSRDAILQEITDAGVACYTGSCSEIYLEKAFSGMPHYPFPRREVARRLGETSLSIPVHPTIDDVYLNRVIEVVSEVMNRSTA